MVSNRSHLKKTLQSESGQGVIEYILVLIVAIILTGLLARVSKQAWDQGVLGLGGNLERSLKTGRAPASAWKN